MEKLRLIIVALLATGLLQACNNQKSLLSSGDDTAVTASKDTSTTLNLAVDKDDSQFAMEAASGNLTEVALGRLAVTNGRDKRVKNFGMMMIKDHGKADNKLLNLARSKSITLPTAPDTADQKMIAALAQKKGEAFDKAYISDMIADHQDDVKKYDEASRKLQDPDLKTFAIKILPILQNHLDAINAIHDSMGN